MWTPLQGRSSESTDGACGAGSIRGRPDARGMPDGPASGMTLVDSIVSLGVVTVLAGVAVPFLITARDGSQVTAAARYLSAQAMLARSRALQHGAAVGLRFEREGSRYRFAVYVDGDGDGIRRADLASGVDRPLGGFQRLQDAYPLVRFELDPAVPPVASSSPAGANADPVRLGQGDTLTFSPLGSATSGSLYLRGRSGHQCALRVLGATGRIRLLCFDRGASAWSER